MSSKMFYKNFKVLIIFDSIIKHYSSTKAFWILQKLL